MVQHLGCESMGDGLGSSCQGTTSRVFISFISLLPMVYFPFLVAAYVCIYLVGSY